MRVSIIAAVAENGVIGRNGQLPWHLWDDLRRFKQLTMGHTVVLGRRTWESIGRPLPGRRMVVVSRRAEDRTGVDGVAFVASLDDAIQFAGGAGDDEVFIIGGEELYGEGLSKASRLYLTRVHAEVDGDRRFPDVDWNDWRLVESEPHAADISNDHPFSFELYERARPD